MEHQAKTIIDALGGTAKVARLIAAPKSTVHSWRVNGIPPSRLEHLKLVASAQGVELPGVDADCAVAAA